jgi:hypothetical protein
MTQFVYTVGFDMDEYQKKTDRELNQESYRKIPVRQPVQPKYFPVSDQQEKKQNKNDRVDDHNSVFANILIKQIIVLVKMSRHKDSLSGKIGWHNH